MKIDLSSLVEKYDLNPEQLRAVLFPNHTHKKLAWNRAVKGDTLLNADQIAALATFIDIPVDLLFKSNESWSMKSSEGVHYFENDEYHAELNTLTWVTKIFHKNSLKHQVILSMKALTLNEYFIKLNSIIKNFKDES